MLVTASMMIITPPAQAAIDEESWDMPASRYRLLLGHELRECFSSRSGPVGRVLVFEFFPAFWVRGVVGDTFFETVRRELPFPSAIGIVVSDIVWSGVVVTTGDHAISVLPRALFEGTFLRRGDQTKGHENQRSR